MSQEFELIRDCSATVIPAGNAVTLPKGSVVFITQTLGGHVTVRTTEGLFRIESVDTDALGPDFQSQTAETETAAAEGGFSEKAVWDALKTCYDPEIPVNIVDLGLVYDLRIQPDDGGQHRVEAKMTLTAVGCGMGPVIANDAREKIEALPEVDSATVDIVWDPPWNPQMISADGRKILGIE
jgi:probable FeS assembly SUF system protein SufT